MVAPVRTLRGRLVLLIGGLLAAVSIFIFVYFPLQMERRAIAAQLATARSIAAVTAFSAAPALVFHDERGLEEAFAAVLQTPDVLYVQAEDSSGVVSARSRGGSTVPTPLVALPPGDAAVVEALVAHLGTNITSGRRTIGRLRVGVSLAGVRREIRQARATVALVSVLVFLLGLAAALGIGAFTTRPLRAMGRTMENIASGHRELRAGVGGAEEVAQLARVFNQMVDSLERAHRDVEEMNRTLQERVEERTRDLEDAQGRLIQAQKMEAVGLLAGGLAHDFNNLLTTISATTELLRSDRPGDTALTAELAHIAEAARRGADMIRQLMVFSRQQRLDPRTAELSDLVTDAVRMLRRLVREDIDIQLALDSGPTTVRADRAAVQQILMNLATNARDAMPAGGTLLLETSREVLDESAANLAADARPGAYVVLLVSDTGKGMTPDVLQHAFEPFFTTKPTGQGAGLGLSSVFGLARQHRGFATISSEAELGTVVRVYFPAASEAEQGVADAAPALSRGRGEEVLLVEDEESLRHTATRVLERHGYRVTGAADGVQALKLCCERELAFDLVVTDVVMPRMGGAELVTTLRAAGAAVPVLFMSGYAARDIENAGLIDPRVPLLQKPWTIAELTARVRVALDAGPVVTDTSATPREAARRLADRMGA